METSYDQHYVDARETLLDAVEALGPHSDAAILVGAQAVYVHTESVDNSFAVAPFTYDADIGLDPERLEDSPAIVDAMCRAGFRLTVPPGTFTKDGGTQVDLMVPAAVGGSGRRGARLGVHGNRAARKVHGLEGTLVSHTRRETIPFFVVYIKQRSFLNLLSKNGELPPVTRQTGQYRITSTTGGEEVRAFVPFPLPPADPPLEIDGLISHLHTAALAESSPTRSRGFGSTESRLVPVRIRSQGSSGHIANRRDTGNASGRCGVRSHPAQ